MDFFQKLTQAIKDAGYHVFSDEGGMLASNGSVQCYLALSGLYISPHQISQRVDVEIWAFERNGESKLASSAVEIAAALQDMSVLEGTRRMSMKSGSDYLGFMIIVRECDGV